MNIGIRLGIKMKRGQASFHRQDNDASWPIYLPVAVCGKALLPSSIRPAKPYDFDRRCVKCFDREVGFQGARMLFDAVIAAVKEEGA